jgi:hypothetical protein
MRAQWVAVSVCAVAMVAVVLYAFNAIGNIQEDNRYTQSCMSNVHEPDPEATDYDRQALEFSTEIRKCMRG